MAMTKAQSKKGGTKLSRKKQAKRTTDRIASRRIGEFTVCQVVPPERNEIEQEVPLKSYCSASLACTVKSLNIFKSSDMLTKFLFLFPISTRAAGRENMSVVFSSRGRACTRSGPPPV